MSKTNATSGADAKKATTTPKKEVNTQLTIQKSKTTAELLQEQKDFFEEKNAIIKRLRVFEVKGRELKEILTNISELESSNPSGIFEKQRESTILFKNSYSEVCTISHPVIVKVIISQTLKEIEKSRTALEQELLSK